MSDLDDFNPETRRIIGSMGDYVFCNDGSFWKLIAKMNKEGEKEFVWDRRLDIPRIPGKHSLDIEIERQAREEYLKDVNSYKAHSKKVQKELDALYPSVDVPAHLDGTIVNPELNTPLDSDEKDKKW